MSCAAWVGYMSAAAVEVEGVAVAAAAYDDGGEGLFRCSPTWCDLQVLVPYEEWSDAQR